MSDFHCFLHWYCCLQLHHIRLVPEGSCCVEMKFEKSLELSTCDGELPTRGERILKRYNSSKRDSRFVYFRKAIEEWCLFS